MKRGKRYVIVFWHQEHPAGQQADEEIAPAHAPSQKTAGPGAICSGACCHFLWKKIMLFGGAAGPQHLR